MAGETRAKPERGGKTREEFLGLFPQMADWLARMEREYGVFERMGSLTLTEGRHVALVCFARAWGVSLSKRALQAISTSGDAGFVITPDALAAIVALHTVLKPQDDTIWDTLIAALVDQQGG